MHISIPAGIIIGLIASLIQSLGLTIQRKSHVLNQRLPEHEQHSEYRRPLWLLGFGVFISSNILGSLVQIASLPVVILAPLGAVSLLWNAFFARLILGDVFSAWMIVATIFIAGGAVLIAIFGIVPEPTRSIEDLLNLFQRTTFVVYFSLLGAVVLFSLIITHVTEYRLNRKIAQSVTPMSDSPTATTPLIPLEPPADPSTLTTGVTNTVTDAITNERTPLLDTKSQPSSSRAPSFLSVSKYLSPQELRSINRTRLLLAISYASFSGIISGMCLLFAKSGVELLLLTVQGHNQFWRWQSWILVLALIIFALLQLWYLHKGLVLADPTLVCPSAFCFYNLSSIVNGLVYFDQFALISPLHLGLVGLGIVILLIGVWVVSIQAGGGSVDTPWVESNEEDEELEVEEECIDDGPHTTDLESGRSSHVEQRESSSPPTDWGTSSEPLIDARHTLYPGSVPLSPRSTTSQPLISPDYLLSHTSPSRNRSSAHRRRPTTIIDTRSNRIPSQSHYNSMHNSTLPRPPLSPTLPTVSTLAGTGFQIGLSPFSPGFSVAPQKRRRISSNMGPGLAASNSTGSTAGSGIRTLGHGARVVEGERRRTVSEGDVKQRTLLLARDSQEGPGESHDDAPEAGRSSDETSGNAADTAVGKGKGRVSGSVNPGEDRRSWWTRFTRRRG